MRPIHLACRGPATGASSPARDVCPGRDGGIGGTGHTGGTDRTSGAGVADTSRAARSGT